MGSDAFRSLFTLYQSKTRVAAHVQMVSHSLRADTEPEQGIAADDCQEHRLQVCNMFDASLHHKFLFAIRHPPINQYKSLCH